MEDLDVVVSSENCSKLVLPKMLFKNLDLEQDSRVEAIINDDFITFKIYNSGCIFCKCEDDIQHFKGQRLCRKCSDELLAESNVL